MNVWNTPSEFISMPQLFWSCGKQFLDPNAPTFQLKTSNLLELNDCLGIVDYVLKSCTGNPYGSVSHERYMEHQMSTQMPTYPEVEIPVCESSESEQCTYDNSEVYCPRATTSADNSDGGDWVNIPVRELLAKNPMCGWKRNRTQLCRRYIESFCARDCDCPFIHATPLSVHRDQIVFLGGLPKDCTRASLFKELIDAGYAIKNYPLVLDRFTPRVVLDSIEAAQSLIEKKRISIFGKEVDVRAYKASSEVFQVFIGGLPSETQLSDIRKALEAQNCELVNKPSMNKGFVINCEVATKMQQEFLIQRGFLEILGKQAQVKRIVKRKRKYRSSITEH